jgi:LPS-assembly lipoprotein
VTRFASLLLIVLLTGCGWQLRGAGAGFGGEAVYVESEVGAGELAFEAARTLSDLGARIVEDPAAADTIVVLVDESVSRTTLAVNERGRATEYELRYSLAFRVEDAGGVLGRQTVRTYQAYDANPLDPLAEQSERERVLRDLREEAVNTMVARVARIRGER